MPIFLFGVVGKRRGVSPSAVTRSARWRLRSCHIVPGLVCDTCGDLHSIRCTAQRLCRRLHNPCPPQDSEDQVSATELPFPQQETYFQHDTFSQFALFLQFKNIDLNFGKGQFSLFQRRAGDWLSQTIMWKLRGKRRKQDSSPWAHSKCLIYILPFKVHFCCQIQSPSARSSQKYEMA